MAEASPEIKALVGKKVKVSFEGYLHPKTGAFGPGSTAGIIVITPYGHYQLMDHMDVEEVENG